METFVVVIDFLIFLLAIGSPILLLIVLKKLNTRYWHLFYFLTGLLVFCGAIWLSVWWTDKSYHILLEYYGYNIDGMSEKEFYGNVLPENMERVKRMETSIMGIGWPLKAMFGMVILSPYLLVVYFGNRVLEKIKSVKNVS